MRSWQEFASRHNLCAVADDVARIKRQLTKFFSAVETIDPPHSGYVQLYDGAAIRSAFSATMQTSMAYDAAIAMVEMPSTWPTKYRASVAYHLAPFLDDVVNS